MVQVVLRDVLQHVFLSDSKNYGSLFLRHSCVVKWSAIFEEDDLGADPCFPAANPQMVSLGLISVQFLGYV